VSPDSDGMGVSMEIWEKLSADIFLSELMLDGVISGLSVRYLAENTDITDIRELYFSKDLLFSLQGKKKSEKNFLSEVERERRKDYAKKMAEIFFFFFRIKNILRIFLFLVECQSSYTEKESMNWSKNQRVD